MCRIKPGSIWLGVSLKIGIRVILKVLLIISATCRDLSAMSAFQSASFYKEMLKRVPELDQNLVKDFLGSSIFEYTEHPVTNQILRKLESNQILKSWNQHKDFFEKVLDDELLEKSEKKLYFHLRDAFRQAGRSTTDSESINAIKRIIRSDYLALISDLRFRVLIKSLEDLGYLHKFYSVVGDLVKIFNNRKFVDRWDVAFNRQKSKVSISDAEIRVSTMLNLASVFSDDFLMAARRIRDSGFLEEYYKPNVQKLVNSDLYKVFFEYFKRDSLASDLQTMMRANLLLPALQSARDSSTKLIREKILDSNYGSKASKLIFLNSSGFKAFVDPEYVVDLIYLSKVGLLDKLPQILETIDKLSDPRFNQESDKINKFLAFKASEISKQKIKRSKKHNELEVCYQNMNAIMLKRKEYNLKYREALNLRNEVARERILEMVDRPGLLRCPSGGFYDTTEYGWVSCSRHGKSLIPNYE